MPKSRAWPPRALHWMKPSYLSSLASFGAPDVIIVGGGSAGCVLANRLSEDPTTKVVLLEAGPKDHGLWDSWKIQMPAALTFNLSGKSRYNWNYKTEPQSNLDHRCLSWPRGRVLGGSSSLNAMVYIRGHARDYDHWQDLGAQNWSYADCLPYFIKAQQHAEQEIDSNSIYRGHKGPLHVTRGPHRDTQPLFRAFIDAGVEAGYPFTSDMNGYQQEGFGWMDMTIHQGKRWSASNAYLHPREVQKRPNLHIETDVLMHKIIMDTRTAVGVEISSNASNASSDTQELRLRNNEGQVILSAGAINSPQLLMLSGIGPEEQLKNAGVSDVVLDLPGVGQNLQDHLDLYTQYECKEDITLYHATWNYPHNMIKIALQWLYNQTGWGASAHLESGGFIRSRAGLEQPDLQFHFLPGALTGQLTPGRGHAMQAHCSPMRATSRGEVRLQSTDPREPLSIDPNYLSTEQDIIDIRQSVRLTQEIFHQRAFDPYRGAALSPLMTDLSSDASIDAWIRSHTESAYHPTSTNRMGEDELAVVDSQCRVRGIDQLCVVDASIMPAMISGNLNAPTIMLAEKAADIIRKRTPLPRASSTPVYQAPNWQTSQR